jgi:hypothetical protein
VLDPFFPTMGSGLAKKTQKKVPSLDRTSDANIRNPDSTEKVDQRQGSRALRAGTARPYEHP